jgi:hypothetical protein
MTKVIRIAGVGWSGTLRRGHFAAAPALEAGVSGISPDLRFAVQATETLPFTPSILGSSKNASYDPASGRLGGTTATGQDAETLSGFIRRFSESAASLAARLFPAYRDRMTRGRASFRPAEIARRRTKWRKDETRLHVDSFPATPSGGRRILRVFSNVNLEARARVAPRRRFRSGRAAVRTAAARAAPAPGI